MKLKNIIARTMLVSPLVLMAACGGDKSAVNPNVKGSASSLTLNISDGPVDSATAVVIEFTGVSFKSAGVEEPTVIEFDEPKSIDLLTLQGTAYESLLSEVQLEAGDYEWIRLFVNAEIDGVMDSYIESKDGTMKELYIPSGSESGLKINTKLKLAKGAHSDFTIDFDLRRSIHMSIGDTEAKLKPSLRMVDNKDSSSIDGLVSDSLISEACADGQVGAVYAYEGKDVVPTDHSTEGGPIASALVNSTDDGYKFELGFLKKGEYTLAYTCDAAIDTPDAVETLTFLNTTSVVLDAHKPRHLDMMAKGEHGRNEIHSHDEDYQGFGKGSWGPGRNMPHGPAVRLSDEEKAAIKAEFEARQAELEAKKAEWDALTEEEKAAKKAEMDALAEVEKAAKKAEMDAKKAEWDALTEEERAAKKAEMDALAEEERAAKKAEMDAKKAEWEAKKSAQDADESDDADGAVDTTADEAEATQV